MRRYIILAIGCCIALTGCDRTERKPTEPNRKLESYQISIIDTADQTRSGDHYTSNSDHDLIQRIRQALRNDFSLSGSEQRIIIHADAGNVTLQGTTISIDQKNAIGNRVRQINGVRAVNNRIAVSSRDLSIAISDFNSDPGLFNQEEEIDFDDPSKFQRSDAFQTERDRTVIQSVRQAITSDRNLNTNAPNIQIMVDNGRVTLQGYVRSENDRSLILSKVRQVPGVKSVDNQLTVVRLNEKSHQVPLENQRPY